MLQYCRLKCARMLPAIAERELCSFVGALLFLSALETFASGALICLPLGVGRRRPCRPEVCSQLAGLLDFLRATEKRGYFCCEDWIVGLSPRAHAYWCGWCILPAAAVSTTASRKHLRTHLSQELNPRMSIQDLCSFRVFFSLLAIARATTGKDIANVNLERLFF